MLARGNVNIGRRRFIFNTAPGSHWNPRLSRAHVSDCFVRNERHRMIQKGKTFKTSNCATRCRLYATKALSYDRDFMILKWSLRGLLRGLTKRRWPSTKAARRTTLTDSVARRAGANTAKTSSLVQGKLHLGPYRFVFNIPPACVRILTLSRAPLSACFAADGRPCMLEALVDAGLLFEAVAIWTEAI